MRYDGIMLLDLWFTHENMINLEFVIFDFVNHKQASIKNQK